MSWINMNWLEITLFWVILPLLFAGAALAFIRLLRGPSLPDRVVALDLMTVAGIGILAVYAGATDQNVLLDVAMVLALVSFLGMIGFAVYIQRSAQYE